MNKPTSVPPNIEGLATLLILQDQIKELSTLKEFGYFTTNETHRLFHFNIAYLWKLTAGSIELLDQSEIAEIDQHSPINQWIQKAIKEIIKIDNANKIQGLNFITITTENKIEKGGNIKENNNEEEIEKGFPGRKLELSKKLMKLWPEAIPSYALWSPFIDSLGDISGGLIFFRDHPYTEQEVKMYQWLGKNYQYTWRVLTKTKLSTFYKWYKKKSFFKIVLLLLFIVFIFPTRLSVTTTAIVESSDPAPISAPIPGTIKDFLIKPGESVKKDQILFTLDKSELIKALSVANEKVLLGESKLRSAVNEGYSKPESANEIPILQAELGVDQAEMEYTKSMLDKTDIVSPIDGIAVFDSKESWIGQPVQAGENILTIADPKKVQLKIMLPVPNLISLKKGDEGKFYVYGEFTEFPVTLSELGYSAKLTTNKVLAYEFIAEFVNPSTAPRIGSQGTVRLYGRYVPFIYFLLRRPLQALRQTIGF